MRVIIIDDQREVVLGMLTGIRWDMLGVTETFCAYSAGEARKIICEHPIDLMLCDIEMPAENGLSLYAWVRDNYPKIKCIFLTSHMEFDYALKALKLESFDYILQPAKYTVVEETIAKALDCISEEDMKEKLQDYGAHWKESEKEVLELLLRDIVLRPEQEVNEEKFLRLMNNLGYGVHAQTIFFPVFIHAYSWNIRLTEWDTDLIKNTVENVITELFERIQIKNLFTMVNRDEFIILLYHPQNRSFSQENVRQVCEEFESFANTWMKTQQGIYIGNECDLQGLTKAVSRLYERDRDNIGKQSGIFHENGTASAREPLHCIETDHWKELLCNGYGSIFLREVKSYLDDAANNGLNDSRGLANFHQEFLLVVFSAAQSKKIDITSIVEDCPRMGDYIRECRSLDDMMEFAQLVKDAFEQSEHSESEEGSLIERAKLYIQKNVENDLSRNMIAGYLYLNPDYLSRLFRKKTGQSLKDYIIEMKIERAKYLMENTPLSIGVIAAKVGFANFSYFSQVFKRITKESPMEYRRHFDSR